MKNLIFLLLPIILYSQSFLVSNIPLPRTYVQNLDPYVCGEECMQEYLDNDMIFSFLAHADSKLENREQDEIRIMNISILNLGSFAPTGNLRIALLLPYKKIGKYAASTTNASFAYLMTKSHPFELKSYKVESEEIQDLQNVLQEIANDGFDYVIAPLTKYGADNVSIIDPSLNVYFPTINKKDSNSSSVYLSFGGIDYKAQSDLLIKEAVSPLVIFYDKSTLGKKLALYEEEKFKFEDENDDAQLDENVTLKNNYENDEYTNGEELFVEIKKFSDFAKAPERIAIENHEVVKYSIARRTTNLEVYLKENEKIARGSFFINTPIVKSGMIMSQLTLYDVNATNVLSTQINYDPLILSMTQYADREKMVLANSITQDNNVLIETHSLLGNDIVYDWINYATTVGVDYFFNLITGEDREYSIPIENNQMIYSIELLSPSLSRFIKYVRPVREDFFEDNEELEETL